MEITKTFSSNTREKLFTICFSELEMTLYSEYLEQKEYVSKRAAKKLAKKAMNAEQEFQDAVKSGADTVAANAKYNKEMGKVMGSKNAQKVLEHDTKAATTTVKAIKNDRAAEQIAGAIGNGNQEVKAEIADSLKKSKGGKGVNVQQHVSAGNYNASGVKQNVVATRNSNAAAQSRLNGARKVNNDLHSQLRNQQQAAEARQRSMQAKFDRELEKARNTGKSTYQPYQHKNGYVNTPKPVSTPTPNPPAVSTPATNIAKGTTTKVTSVVPKNITAKEVLNKKASGQYLKKGMKFVKNHKLGVGLGAAGLTAAGATGAYLYNKKKNQ
jgi:uncharacterized protein YqeY